MLNPLAAIWKRSRAGSRAPRYRDWRMPVLSARIGSGYRARDRMAPNCTAESMPALICGVGLGREFRARARSRSPSTRVVVVEPDEATARALLGGCRGSARLGEPLGGARRSGLYPVPRPLRDGRPASRTVITVRWWRVSSRRVAAALRDAHRSGDEPPRRTFAPRPYLLANMPRLAPKATAHLSSAFTGVPAMSRPPVVARSQSARRAGRSRALIPATRPPGLVSAGVCLIVAVDASERTHGIFLLCRRATAFSSARRRYPALSPFDGRTFFFRVADHEPWPWLRSLGLDRGRLDATGSVATTAFALALEMGYLIIFVGADFASPAIARRTRTSFETIRQLVAGGQTDGVWRYWWISGRRTAGDI
jgi:hypothetical protein